MTPRGRCPACTADPRRDHTDEELKEFHRGAILVNDADGFDIPIDAGEFYLNPKARPRRMMRNSLSSDARQVYACLELATMGFQQELAVKMVANKRVPLTPADVANQTGLSKQHVRRGMAELEAVGLGERRGDTKGKVLLYSWAVPREVETQNGSHARLPFPSWFPENNPLAALVRRLRLVLLPDLGATRGYHLERIEEAARNYQEAEMVAIEVLKGVSAPAKTAAHKRKNERTSERTGDAPSSSSSVEPEPEPQMMVVDPHLSEMAQAASAVAEHSDAGNDWVVSHLLSETREVAPVATATEIVEQIHAHWTVASKKENPLGYLVKCVAKSFTPVVLAQRRARARAAAEEASAAMRRAEERAAHLRMQERKLSDEEARARYRAMTGEKPD